MPEIIRPLELNDDNIVEQFKCWQSSDEINFIGLVKCRIIPPRHLYLPVIPIRIPNDERLLFPLCIRCAKYFHKEPTIVPNDFECTHSDRERAFTTTITTIELKEALSNGYQINKIFRIWRYAEKDTTIFRDFVRMFMRLKIEASGFPHGIETVKQKEKFQQDYIDNMGIEINLSKVEFNPGLRHISKIVLNR